MAYIGVPPYGQTIRSVTNITATSGQTTFNITGGYQVGYVDVYLNGVLLVPGTDFTATDTLTVELTSGATTGDNFQAFSYQPVALVDTYRKSEVDSLISAISVTPTDVSSQANTATDYFMIPKGTTAQRPASPATGMLRYNTDESEYEVFDGITWTTMGNVGYSYNIDYLVIAGGGGGGSSIGGGGGAGGLVYGSAYSVNGGSEYNIIVGAGGPCNTADYGPGFQGENSQFASTTAAVGGGLGGGNSTAGGLGGSGGGGGSNSASGNAAGAGTTGQGYTGGAGSVYHGGGGGGSGGAGSAANGTSSAGNGGDGSTTYSTWLSAISSAMSGVTNWGTATSGGAIAGGGGGAIYNNSGTAGSGGAGGGGAGGQTTVGVDGVANTGSGGGGGPYNAGPIDGGNGGSGIVIIRYSGSPRNSSGSVVSSGGYTYHVFTSSGTYTA